MSAISTSKAQDNWFEEEADQFAPIEAVIVKNAEDAGIPRELDRDETEKPIEVVHTFENYNKYKYLYLSNHINETHRYLAIFLLFILGYIFPLVCYRAFLRRPHASPGAAAALCIFLGGLFVSSPLTLLLMARDIPHNGSSLSWYSQFFNYYYIIALMILILIFVFLANQTKIEKKRD